MILPTKGKYVFVVSNQKDWDILIDFYGPSSKYIQNNTHTLRDLKSNFKKSNPTHSMNVVDGSFDGHSDTEYYSTDSDYEQYNFIVVTNLSEDLEQVQETEYIIL